MGIALPILGGKAASLLPVFGSWAMFIVGSVVFVLVLPPYLSLSAPKKEEGAADIDLWLQEPINELVQRLGFDSERHWTSEIERLVLAQEIGEAARIYRDRKGVTWDKAFDIVNRWRDSSAQRKLEMLLEYLRESTPPMHVGQEQESLAGTVLKV